MSLHDQQLALEDEMFNGGIRRFEAQQRRFIEGGEASQTASNRKLMKEYISPMAMGLSVRKYIEEVGRKRGRKPIAYNYLRMIPEETASFIAMKVTLDAIALQDEAKGMALAIKVGERIEDQVRFSKLEGEAAAYMAKVKEHLEKNATSNYKHKRTSFIAAERKLTSNGNAKAWAPWPRKVHASIGETLLTIMTTALVFEGEPVFISKNMHNTSQAYKVYQLSPAIHAWEDEFLDYMSALSPCYSPCIEKPLDWTSPFNGGFHSEEMRSRTKLVKGNKNHVKTLTRAQMPKVYKAVNALQAVEWAVNERVLAVAETIRDDSLDLGMPSRNSLLESKPVNPVPAQYAHLKTSELNSVLTESEWSAFMQWRSDVSKLYTEDNKRKSQLLASSRLLKQARKYTAFDKLYFVYTLDSRQRVYCKSTGLNPQSDDLGKSMLMFAKGDTIKDQASYEEFSYTGANLWGWDKKPLLHKLALVNDPEFVETCHDIAADPITFRGWLNADDPWQFLAWALEFSEYHQLKAQGKEYKFRTHLPNGRDGSCSGIQHYSTMMLDSVAGAMVNLTPSEAPQDIYGEVAKGTLNTLTNIVNGDLYDFGFLKSKGNFVKDDEGEKVPSFTPAEQVTYARIWLDLGFGRDLTKKPVMTLPYGSSSKTCREHVKAYLEELQANEDAAARREGRPANPMHPFGGSDSKYPMNKGLSFIVKLIWDTIKEKVVAPVVAMRFIKKIARTMAKANKPMIHTTPTGFRVYQAIYQTEECRVNTSIAGSTRYTLLEETDEMDEAGMASSAAPNFVHSMDSSHLVFVVCAMVDAGINRIHVIHDDFGTVANRTVELGVILRVTFVEMYEDKNYLKDYLVEMEVQLCESIDVDVPEQFDLDIRDVLSSLYTFA